MDIDHDLFDDIEELVDRRMLLREDAAYGVAQQVIDRDRGFTSLTPKQRAVYDAVIVPLLTKLHEQREADRRQSDDD